MENKQIPQAEFHKSLSAPKMKLPLLPELEMMEAEITSVIYQYSFFGGKPNYITNENKELVLDANGQPIQKKEFAITFALKDFTLNDGKPRKQWLRLGASLNEKAKLKKFLTLLGCDIPTLTPQLIIDLLTGTKVKFQLVNKPDDAGNIWQNINFDSIRLVAKADKNVKEPADVVWEE